VLAASGSYHGFGAAVSANACPEIVISIAMDAAKAKFLVIVLFPYCSGFPIAGNAHRSIWNAQRVEMMWGSRSADAIKFRITSPSLWT
jgi:hypothetical protein